MPAIWQLIPDAEQVLALEPEELGSVLLRVFADPQISQNGMFSPSDVAFAPFSRQPTNYPAQYRQEVSNAILEAASWLEAVGLIMQAPNQAVSFKKLTRRGRKLLDADAFVDFRKASVLPRQLLHPKVAEAAFFSFLRGRYDTAVFEAFKAVEVSVREAAGLTATDIGVPLMRKAFNVDNGRLRIPDQESGERQALSDLFAGAIGSYKNPHSHRTVAIEDPTDAVEMLMLASHLLRIVDARKEFLALL